VQVDAVLRAEGKRKEAEEDRSGLPLLTFDAAGNLDLELQFAQLQADATVSKPPTTRPRRRPPSPPSPSQRGTPTRSLAGILREVTGLIDTTAAEAARHRH